jgi:hypothetical protein
MGRGVVVAAVLAATLGVIPAAADNNPNGTLFRAVGWFRGEAQISEDGITCEIPSVSEGIPEGSFAMGLWNTFGEDTISYPNANLAFANPCGGYIQVQTNLLEQGMNVERVDLKFRVAGARQFRQFVPTRNGFPTACRSLRRARLFVGTRLNPPNSTDLGGPSGAPNVAFLQLLPQVSPQLFQCLRSQYAALPTDVLVSLPLVIRATAVGRSDSGEVYRTNTVAFTLNLRHQCGNARLDDGEQCDPATPFSSCFQDCENNVCSVTGAPCLSSGDCPGTCLPQGIPSECVCVF